MIKLTKIQYHQVPLDIKNKVSENDYFEYYQVIQDKHSLGYLIAYDNEFHGNNKYLYPFYETFASFNTKEIFKVISNYFNKPLQVMIDSKEAEIINVLKKVGFKLKRQSFEREYNIGSVKNLNNFTENIEIFNKGTKPYDEACEMAYKHYVSVHANVNPLTVGVAEFAKILPNQVICQIFNNQIVNLVFLEDNELCYITSLEITTFELFAHAVIKYIFSKYETITFETDTTDFVALKLKSYFHNETNDSHDTYIFT